MDTTTERFKATTIVDTLREQGRSMTWLARTIGVSRQYTSDIAHGNRACGRELAERMSAALGLPLFLAFDLLESNESLLERVAS